MLHFPSFILYMTLVLTLSLTIIFAENNEYHEYHDHIHAFIRQHPHLPLLPITASIYQLAQTRQDFCF